MSWSRWRRPSESSRSAPPECGVACASSSPTSCAATDLQCICLDTGYLNAFESCLESSCDENDGESYFQLFQSECTDVDVFLTLTAGLTFSGESSSATSAQSSSVSTSANGSTSSASSPSPSPTSPTHSLSASVTANSAPPLSSPSTSSHHTNDAVIGGVVGGVLALLVACLLALFLLRRRRRTRQQDYTHSPAAPAPAVVAGTAPVTLPSQPQRAVTPSDAEFDPYAAAQQPSQPTASSSGSGSESTSNRISLRRPIAAGVVTSQAAMLEKATSSLSSRLASSSAPTTGPTRTESTSGPTATSETQTQRELREMRERVALLEAQIHRQGSQDSLDLEPPPEYS